MYINKIQITLFILVFTITPFIFSFITFDAFEFPKIYFISISLLLISLLTIVKKVQIRLNLLDIILILFLALNVLGGFFSKDPMYAFFGYFGNPSGSIFYLFSIIIFLILHKEFIVSIKKITFLKLTLYSGVLPCLYGILQLLRIDPFKWYANSSYERVFSTFGQPNFYAIFLGLLLFSSIIYYLETKNKLILLYTVFILLLLLNTKSIGVFISVFVCFLFLFFVYLNKIKQKTITFLLLILLMLIFLYVIYPRIISQISSSSNYSVIRTNDTAKIRLILWESTIKQSSNFKTLIIGNGVENFAFTLLRPVDLNKTSEWSLVFFKPHNLFIESLYANGILGLLFYLFVTVYSCIHVRNNPLYLLIIFLLISSFFLWLPSYLSFFLFVIFYYLFSFSNHNFNFSTSRLYKIFLVPVLYIFVLSCFFVVSNIFFTKKPCISYNIFPNFQPYVVSCGIASDNKDLVAVGYNLNELNKLYIEKSGLYFLNKNDKRGLYIFEQAYMRDPYDPVYMYYYGLSNEIFGNNEKALKLYKKAKENSSNFYLNESALIRVESK